MMMVFINQIGRSALRLAKDSGDILAKDTDGDELNGTEEQHDSHNGRIALNGISPNQDLGNNPCHIA